MRRSDFFQNTLISQHVFIFIGKSLSSKIFPKIGFKATYYSLFRFKLDRFTEINFALLCCQVEHASHLSKT